MPSPSEPFPKSHLPTVDADSMYAKVSNQYVAWVDMMGARAAMGRSLRQASTAIVKIHAVMMDVCNAEVSFINDADVYPVIDGVYIVTKERAVLEMLLACAMHRLASIFVHESKQENRFLVRGGIAAGRVVTGLHLAKSCEILSKVKRYSECLAIGSAIGQAYQAESNAPPFGLYVDITARSFVGQEAQPFLEVLWRWWEHHGVKGGDAVRRGLGEALLKYYEWICANRRANEYARDRIEEHREAAREYFQMNG